MKALLFEATPRANIYCKDLESRITTASSSTPSKIDRSFVARRDPPDSSMAPWELASEAGS